MQARQKVLSLYRDKYRDFNFSHFTDNLKEVEKIDISRSRVTRILAADGIRSKKSINRRLCVFIVHARRGRSQACCDRPTPQNSSGLVRAKGMPPCTPTFNSWGNAAKYVLWARLEQGYHAIFAIPPAVLSTLIIPCSSPLLERKPRHLSCSKGELLIDYIICNNQNSRLLSHSLIA